MRAPTTTIRHIRSWSAGAARGHGCPSPFARPSSWRNRPPEANSGVCSVRTIPLAQGAEQAFPAPPAGPSPEVRLAVHRDTGVSSPRAGTGMSRPELGPDAAPGTPEFPLKNQRTPENEAKAQLLGRLSYDALVAHVERTLERAIRDALGEDSPRESSSYRRARAELWTDGAMPRVPGREPPQQPPASTSQGLQRDADRVPA